MATPRPPGLVCLSLGPDDHTYAVQVSRQRTRDTAAGAGESQPSPRRAPDMQVAIYKSGACAWLPLARVASRAVSSACDWPQNLARTKACETDLPFDMDQVHRHSVCGALAQRTPRSGGYAQAGWRPTVTRV